MSTDDSGQDVWARLRAYCQEGHLERYPPLSEEQASELERNFGVTFPPDMYHLYTAMTGGFMERPDVVCYPPATEEQLRATEEKLGFPLPPDLRRLYSEIANGGLNLGIAHVFFGAIGGCPVNPGWRMDTIEQLASESSWRLHPRIEQALLRNPGYYVVADSSPQDFLWIAEDSQISIEINTRTGRIYSTEYWDRNPNAPEDNPMANGLISIELVAPSLADWLDQWLDHSWVTRPHGGQLPPEMVEADDLPDPDVVWRGLYRFGPDWGSSPDDAEDDDSLSRYPLDK